MNKTMIRAVIAGLLLFAAPQVAAANNSCCAPSCDPCCDPCWDPCDCCGDWEVGVHALVFQPLTCRWDFARRIDQDNGDSFSTVETIDPSLDWGVRVWGKYSQDKMFLSVGYQWFEATERGRLLGDGNVAIRHNGDGDDMGSDARARLSWRYQNVDVRVGGMKRKCNSEMYGFINGRWVDLRYKRDNSLFDVDGGGEDEAVFTTETARFSGGALGLGFGGRKDLFCDVGLFAELNLLGVIGSHKTSALFFEIDGGPPEDLSSLTYSATTTISPELDFRVGVDYSWNCDCWSLVFEIGYELDYFWNVFDFPSDVSEGWATGDDEWITHCEDVGFSGLFFGVRALF